MAKKQAKSLDNIAPPTQPPQLKRLIQRIQAEIFEGPLPHPDFFKKYEEILPGSAQRILKMAEKQSKHRQSLEVIKIRSESRDSLLGLVFGFLIGSFVIIGGVVCIVSGHQISGSIISLTGVTSLVGTFIYGSRLKMKASETEETEFSTSPTERIRDKLLPSEKKKK